MQVLNYDFGISKTDWKNIEVYRDEDGFPYVLHKGKRLYYKKGASDKKTETVCSGSAIRIGFSASSEFTEPGSI